MTELSEHGQNEGLVKMGLPAGSAGVWETPIHKSRNQTHWNAQDNGFSGRRQREKGVFL